MKLTNKIKGIFVGVSSILLLGSCSDFLEKTPLDQMSDENYFTQETDLKFYMNGLYDGVIRGQGRERWRDINGANDDVVGEGPSSTLMRHSVSGMAGETSSSWNGSYDYIRKVNYFLNNAYRVNSISGVGRHYIGEGYYCRAVKYFDLLQSFGGVPYFDKVLNTDSEELYRPRDSRSFVAEKIIADLDSAIVLLSWKGDGEAKSGRINKESALLMKSRIALYEGSWEYYHGRKNTPFAVKGSNGQNYLQLAVNAANELIEKYGDAFFAGPEGKEYSDIFNKTTYDKMAGAFLYKDYSAELGVYHNWEGGLHEGALISMTQSAVDNYLMSDGKPQEISSIDLDEKTMNDYCLNKDPRLRQTVWCPANGLFYNLWPGLPHAYKTSYPGLTITQQRHPTYSGYRVMKGVSLNAANALSGFDDTDDLILRYAEALLNYAEAKAILGTITQEDLDRSVNYLRQRVHMPVMNLNEINSWAVTYSKRDGFDPTAPNILNEIRRERRVELMLEGLRYTDIKRWAMLDDVFNGWIPLGATSKEFVDYWNNPERLAEEGFNMYAPEKVKLVKGNNYDEIDGRINPFFKNADFKPGSGRGYYVNPERDYLNFIPREEITLYKDNANVTLEQNPGWF